MSRPPQRQRKPGERHARVGIGIDVAACSRRDDPLLADGEQGPTRPPVLFAQANRFVTCEACKVKRQDSRTSAWQLARLRKIAKNRKLSALSAYTPRG